MKWLLIYTVTAQVNAVSDRIEYETRALCEQSAVNLLRFSKTAGLRGRAVCQNVETGESFEVELPKETTV